MPVKSSEFTLKNNQKIIAVINKYKKAVPKGMKVEPKKNKSSFNTSRNRIMAKIRKNTARKKSHNKSSYGKTKRLSHSVIGISEKFKPQNTGKKFNKFKCKRNSFRNTIMFSKLVGAANNNIAVKIKPIKNSKKSKSRSNSSKRKSS